MDDHQDRPGRDEGKEALQDKVQQARYGNSDGFEDKKGWLKLVGGLMVFAGILLLLLLFGIITYSMSPEARAEGAAFGPEHVALFAIMFGLPAGVQIVLGWGSIAAKRWARALIRIIAGAMLFFVAMAVYVMVVMSLFGPAQVTPAGEGPYGLFSAIFIAVIFGCPNYFMYWLYGRREVVATFEKHDPVIRWTDTKPLLVIGIALASGLTVVGMALGILFVMLTGADQLMPAIYFGIIIPGMLGNLTNLAVLVLTLYYTIAFWKLQPQGWWGLVALIGFYTVSAFVTQLVLTPSEMLAATTGLGPEVFAPGEFEAVESDPLSAASILMVLGIAAGEGALFWRVRKYFGIGGAAGA